MASIRQSLRRCLASGCFTSPRKGSRDVQPFIPRRTSAVDRHSQTRFFSVVHENVEHLTYLEGEDSHPAAKYGGRYQVTMLPGAGIGPEMMRHVKDVFRYGGVPVDFEEVIIDTSKENFDDVKYALTSIKRNGVALKANIETHRETMGTLSRNVLLRTELDLFAQVVHCKTYPGIPGLKHDPLDIMIFRQNTEGEYSMQEHESVKGVIESLKVITEENSRRLARFTFQAAKRMGRKKVTVVHKANIMKLSDGLFLRTCQEVGEEFPEIETASMIVDNCCMQLVSNPKQFDVLLMPNLYGAVVTNIICGLTGGPGLFSGWNYGDRCSVFETASRNVAVELVGKNVANPVTMLNAGADMLDHLGLEKDAARIRFSIAHTLNEDKIHTPALTLRRVEPVGRCYVSHSRLQSHSAPNGDAKPSPRVKNQETKDLVIEDDLDYLRSLDPKNWKDQDHYAVLGLKSLRIRATDEDLKKAYRQKVLRHHPDKRRAAGEEVLEDDDYFTCITKAYEILGNPIKRISYDSVDHTFDNSIPSVSAYNKEHFFKVFGPVFERNSQWSIREPVPRLGQEDSSRDEVEDFYAFWYDFESWREYSYLDKEEKEKGQDREERRWIEKENRAERKLRKKEEMSRIRKLVDAAYACDPRIIQFKEEDKEKRAATKRAKAEAARLRQIEEEQRRKDLEEEEQRKRAEVEAVERRKNEERKKEKEAMKKALKKERKNLRGFMKDHNYFGDSDADVVNHMAELDKLCEVLSLQRLEELNEKLSLVSENASARKQVFLDAVRELNERLDREKQELLDMVHKASSGSSTSAHQRQWDDVDLQLLIKAVNLFPAGTNQRWDVVAQFINQHSSSGLVRTGKEVLAKAKDLQKSDYSNNALRQAANEKAFEKLQKETAGRTTTIDASQTQRFDSPAEQQGLNLDPWTPEEQRLLEQALKTYPSSTSDRWDRIGACIPNRSKKDCMRRYKELAELVRAKKAAQAGVQNKKS